MELTIEEIKEYANEMVDIDTYYLLSKSEHVIRIFEGDSKVYRGVGVRKYFLFLTDETKVRVYVSLLELGQHLRKISNEKLINKIKEVEETRAKIQNQMDDFLVILNQVNAELGKLLGTGDLSHSLRHQIDALAEICPNLTGLEKDLADALKFLGYF